MTCLLRRFSQISAAVLIATHANGLTFRAEQGAFTEPAIVGGIQVYLKTDFVTEDVSFQAVGNSALSDGSQAGLDASGRGLHIGRSRPGGYFGARTEQIRVKGTRGLKIAFTVRARGMQTVTINLFDEVHSDNTTPTSPARVADDEWRAVVFAGEDFHFNADPPERKVAADTSHTSLMLYGQERSGASGEFWIDKLVVYRGHDAAPPAAPRDVETSVGSDGEVRLQWKEPGDNAFAAHYSVYRKAEGAIWEKIGESIQPQYADATPVAGTYTYRITAADFENNVSAPSDDVSVIVTSSAAAGKAPSDVRVADRRVYAENVRRIHGTGEGRVRRDVFLFAGDSITAANMYSDTLASWLGRGIAVRQGVGQVTTDYGKAQIGEYLAQSRPEFAIVMYGTNDPKDSRSIDRAMTNLTAVIDACENAGTVPILATIPPRGYAKRDQRDQTRFNLALAKLCRTKKVPVSYSFEEMMERDLRQMLYDGVHLTPGHGNDTAGEALIKTFQQIEFALRDSSQEWK